MINFIKYLTKYQLRLQGILLWVVAFYFINSNTFWLFAIPGILATGLQDILDEVRKISNKDEDED